MLGYQHSVITQSLCLLQHFKWVYHRQANAEEQARALVNNQSCNRPTENDGSAYTFLQLKQEENNKEELRAPRDRPCR